MKTHLLEISSSESLSILRSEARRGRPHKFNTFVVRVPGASDATNDEWRKRIERDYFACGCAEGAWGSLIGVVGGLGWIISRPGGWSSLSWTHGLLLLGCFVLATGIAKLIGLQAARRRLMISLNELAHAFPFKTNPPDAGRPEAQCAVHS